MKDSSVCVCTISIPYICDEQFMAQCLVSTFLFESLQQRECFLRKFIINMLHYCARTRYKDMGGAEYNSNWITIHE